MGLFTNEFIDIIDWASQQPDTLVWKFPRFQNEIKMNAKLTVREGQQAVFINEGQIADVYKPGMYTLHTENMPILSTLKGWKYGFNSPFKADVIFVSTRKAVDQKWGTRNAITVSDDRFGMIELRAFGTYSFSITDAGKFIKEIVGIQEEYTNDDITGQLKSVIATRFSTAAGSGSITIDKFAANLDALSELIKEKIAPDFAQVGLKLESFYVENVSMPEDLKKEIFEYSRLGRVNMAELTRMKTAQSIPLAAANEGMGGLAAGLGAGMATGNVMANAMNQGQQIAGSMPPPLPMVQYYTGINGQQEGPYDMAGLQRLVDAGALKRDTLVWTTGMPAWAAADTVGDLKILFVNTPPPLM